MGINRREVEAAIADTVFDNKFDQQKAAKNLKTYTLTFDSTQDFEKQLEQHIENMRRMGRSLFTDCEEMSNKHAISVAMGKPWNLKTVDVSHSSRFTSKHRGDAIRMYDINNQEKYFLLTIEEFKKVFPAVQCQKIGDKIRIVDKNAVFDIQFDSKHDWAHVLKLNQHNLQNVYANNTHKSMDYDTRLYVEFYKAHQEIYNFKKIQPTFFPIHQSIFQAFLLWV
jgi:hypothetical protein